MERIESIQALRGIAVLMICAVHFFSSHNALSPPELRFIAGVGVHGVTVFFVISGFVLPLALSRVDYSVSNFPRFVLKRLVRLEPPYIATILLLIPLNFMASMTPGFQGSPPEVDLVQVISHLGYLAPAVGKPWLVGIFWSLLVEVQFYVLIGLTFAILRRHPIAWIVVLALPAAFATSWHGLALHIPMFLIGTAAFAWRAGWIRVVETLVLCLLLAALLSIYRGADYALFALLAAAYILWGKGKSRVLLMAGTISYSLYLMHMPFGLKALHLADRFDRSGILDGVIGFGVALMAAIALWYLVERHATRIASRISYRGSPTVGIEGPKEGEAVRRGAA